MEQWLYVLKPIRQTLMEDATDEENAAIGAHFEYLKDLLADGRLILAGPSLSPLFGLVVFEMESEEEARAVMEADPSVRAGVQTAELHPFRASLLRGS